MSRIRSFISSFIERQHIDVTYWVIFIVFIGLSVLSIFSSASYLVYRQDSIFGPIATHIVFLLMGVVVTFVVQFFPSVFIRRFAYIIWAISIIGLVLLLCHFLPFVRPVNGAYRWLFIGPFSIQPAEFAKLSLIIIVADLLTYIRSKKDVFRYFRKTLILSGLTCGLIAINNLSTAIILGVAVVLVWFIANIPKRYIFSVVTIVTVLLIGTLSIIKFGYIDRGRPVPSFLSRSVTHINRIGASFRGGDKYTLTDENYQAVWSMIAIANGGATLLGVGPGNSMARDFLPLAFEEYNFSIILEEFGITGGIVIMFLYVAVLFRSSLVSNRFDDKAAVLMVLGLAMMMCVQAIVSMMVATGIGIVTGQPLPMLCKGGSSILSTCIYFGIFMAVSREQKMRYVLYEQVRTASENEVPKIIIEQ